MIAEAAIALTHRSNRHKDAEENEVPEHGPGSTTEAKKSATGKARIGAKTTAAHIQMPR
jgi:hypothetical protein